MRHFSVILSLLIWNIRSGESTSCSQYGTSLSIERDEPLSGIFFTFNVSTDTNITMGSSANFLFDSTNKTVSTTGPLSAQVRVVTFSCTKSGSPPRSILMSVAILDVNDKLPTWSVGSTPQSSSSVSIQEGPTSKDVILPGSTVPEKPVCNGNDAPFVDNITLEIMNGTNSDKFQLNSVTGNQLKVKVLTELDYEETPRIVLTVRCYDRDVATRRLVGTADFTFTINVVNVVEKGSYTFEHSSYEAQLRANASLGTVLTTSPAAINATNSKAETPVFPVYSISFIEPSVGDYFSLNNATGQMKLIKANPTPRTNPYKVTLTVGIRDDASVTANTASLDIKILPAIEVPPHFVTQSLRPVTIPETSQSGPASLPIATIRVAYSEIAGYTPPARNITFSVLTYNETFGFFGCSKDSCSLRLIRKLDFENGDKQFVVNVSIYDNVTTPVVGSLVITVTDVNDNAPVFLENKYVFRNVRKVAGEVIGTVQATDADKDSNIAYSINDTSNFRINAQGNITFNTDPQKLTDTRYSFTVKASDGDNHGVAVVTIDLGVSAVSTANTAIPAIAGLAAAVVFIIFVLIISICYFKHNAKARRGDQPDATHAQTTDPYYVYGMTTVQENPICTDIYGEEDGLDMEIYRGDRSVGEIQLTDTGGVGAQSPAGGSIRTVMSGSTNSFPGNSQSHLIPNGNSLKLSTNSMELVTADNAVNGGPIDHSQQEGKDQLTIYF